MRAILYSRWSSLEQSGTTSAPRQLELNEAFAAKQGWSVDERVVDEGRSAWTGENIRTGNLGKLVERLEREGGEARVIVVEKLDRLSRQAPLIMAAWLQRACATGLSIATADGAHMISAASLQQDQMTVLGLIFEAFRGFSESQAKSVRVAEAWARKRHRGAAMTRKCPAWLTIAAGDTCFRSAINPTAAYTVIEERAELVRWIFEMTASGMGKAAIAADLNRRAVPPWGRGRGWHASYIQKITRNPAVIGEYQPHVAPRGGRRVPIGPPIAKYFPTVVTDELFAKVNDDGARRVLAQQSASRLVNLFSGIGRCAACGATMSMLNKGTEMLAGGKVVERRYLKCSAAHRAAGCGNTMAFPYRVVEDAVLDHLLHLAMDNQHFASAPDVTACENRVLSAARSLAKLERQQQVAYAAMEDDAADELAVSTYRARRDAVKEARAELERLRAELTAVAGAVSPQEHLARVADVRAMLNAGEDEMRYQARARVKRALNDIVLDVQFSGRKRRISVALIGGARTMAFDLVGSVGIDIDWHEERKRRPDWPPIESSPAVAAYLRRKGASKRIIA